MFDPGTVAKDFSEASARYDAHARLQQQVLTHLLQKAKPLLPSGARVLDAGCGTGKLAREWTGFRVTQFDLAFAMCEVARKSGSPAVNGTVTALPFPDRCFDAIISSLVLQWVQDSALALKEMRRVLLPGGVLALSMLGPETLHELRESFRAVDAYPHVLPFTPLPHPTASEKRREYFPDLVSLMRALKDVGARNKLASRRKSLTTPAQLRRLEAYYRKHFATAQGLPATWDIRYFVERVS